MAAKVCRSVLLLSRSSGAVAGSFPPALVVSSQRHHQHIRPSFVKDATGQKVVKVENVSDRAGILRQLVED